ncbi:MAG: MarR family transcriptional regulator [Frankiaceae bacterium]|nr:MarR family transcriptional regulator [Frankiaceae bacterium]
MPRSAMTASTAPTQPGGGELTPSYAITLAARQLGRLTGTNLSRIGVTTGQLPVLLVLFEQDGLTQAELARTVGIEQPTMALTLRRMERDGLVTRTRDTSDARRSHVKLTPAAKRKKASVLRIRDEIDTQLLASFSPTEQKQLRKLLVRLATQLTEQ